MMKVNRTWGRRAKVRELQQEELQREKPQREELQREELQTRAGMLPVRGLGKRCSIVHAVLKTL